MTGDDMIEAIRYGVRRHGIRFWLIDHLGYLFDPEDDDQRLPREAFVRKLHSVGLQDDCRNLLIAHPSYSWKARPRDRIRITDLKDTSAIAQDAMGGLVVERGRIQKGEEFPHSWVHVDKLRGLYGVVGAKVKLYYDAESASFADRWDTLPAARRLVSSTSPPEPM
jgi:hypothetical protein